MTHDALVAQIRRLPPTYRRVLGAIACGQEHGHPRRALTLLHQQGLIERQGVKASTPFGSTPVIHYTLSRGVRAAWAAWCVTHPEESVSSPMPDC